MNKSILTVLFGILFNSAHAQIDFGLKGGINLANINIDASVDKKQVTGFHGGGFLQKPITKKLFLQLELLYSLKGFEAPSNLFLENQKVSLSYITLPVQVGYVLNNNLSLLLGPEVGYLLNAKADYGDLDLNETELYKKIDLGIDTSIDYKLFDKFGVSFRYNYGISNLGGPPLRNRDNNDVRKSKTNRVLQFSLFYMFNH